MNLNDRAKSLFHRFWPLLAGIGVFVVAQTVARLLPHSCT